MESDAIDVIVLAEANDDVLASRAPRDFQAFAELYRRHLWPMYRFARSQVGDDSTAEDVTAQVFLKALVSAATFRGEGPYRAWLYRIAHNVIATWRKQKATGAVVVDELPEAQDPSPTPAMQAIGSEERELVRREIAELPPAQREVVALRYLEDFSIEEVAGVTNRTRGAVRILLHRARIRLRKSLEGRGL